MSSTKMTDAHAPLVPRKCGNVSPQCPEGQERGYRIGYYHGQIDMADEHDGTPCRMIRMQQEVDAKDALIARLVDALNERDGGVHDIDCKALREHGPKVCTCGHVEARAALSEAQGGE